MDFRIFKHYFIMVVLPLKMYFCCGRMFFAIPYSHVNNGHNGHWHHHTAILLINGDEAEAADT